MTEALSLQSGAKVLNEFISLGKELTKLPILPKYKDSAKDLYSICKRILESNEHAAKWVNRFLYFDFNAPTAPSDFLAAAGEYETMKNGPERRQLKFNCGDIQGIYQLRLANKIGQWFVGDQSKFKNAERIFNDLSRSDAEMVQFVEEHLLTSLDDVVAKMETAVENKDMNEAESVRIMCKKRMKDLTSLIQSFNNEFTDLVIEFARIAKTPITLVDKEK